MPLQVLGHRRRASTATARASSVSKSVVGQNGSRPLSWRRQCHPIDGVVEPTTRRPDRGPRAQASVAAQTAAPPSPAPAADPSATPCVCPCRRWYSAPHLDVYLDNKRHERPPRATAARHSIAEANTDYLRKPLRCNDFRSPHRARQECRTAQDREVNRRRHSHR